MQAFFFFPIFKKISIRTLEGNSLNDKSRWHRERHKMEAIKLYHGQRGAVVNINMSQLLWLTGLNQVLWINLTGKIRALYELTTYLTPSCSTIVGFMWISMAFFFEHELCDQIRVSNSLSADSLHSLHRNLSHYNASSGTCVALFSHIAYWFHTSLNLGLETWNVGSFFLFSRKTHLEHSCDIFKKANKSKPSTFLGRG